MKKKTNVKAGSSYAVGKAILLKKGFMSSSLGT